MNTPATENKRQKRKAKQMKLSEYGRLEVSVETSRGFIGAIRADALLARLGEDLEVHETSEAGRCLFLENDQATKAGQEIK